MTQEACHRFGGFDQPRIAAEFRFAKLAAQAAL
jgi:hypothetical protein